MKNKIKIDKRLIKVFIPGLVFLVVFFSLFFISNNSKVINSLAKLFYEDEVELDNWEISTVFYDSTVNNGQTPLTEINWDASDTPLSSVDTRIITVQINYKNTNTVTSYEPGDLEITIPVLDWINSGSQCYITTNFGVNDNSHTGYDWNLKGNTGKVLTFSNAKPIENASNLEGSIRLEYTIDSWGESSSYSSYSKTYEVEYKEDECTHLKTSELMATLNSSVQSNKISYNFTRKYTHPWQHFEHSITKEGTKISSYDRLGQNANNYTWVRYKFFFYTQPSGTSYSTYNYPYIFGKSDSYKIVDDQIPEGCKVYDNDGNQILEQNGKYTINIPSNIINSSSSPKNYYVYVGYPKNLYNEDDYEITNHVTLNGIYYDEEEETELAEADTSLNLKNFKFLYTGSLYSISKDKTVSYANNDNQYYQGYTGIDSELTNDLRMYIKATARYNGQPMNVMIGDDVLYITKPNGEFRKLEDNEYKFTKVTIGDIKNANDQTFSASKYDGEIWVRYAGEDEYTLYGSANSSTITFNGDKKVVAFYLLLKDCEESIIFDYHKLTLFAEISGCEEGSIAENGRIYNFGFVKVFVNGELQNAATLNNYSPASIREQIGNYDLETHGAYIQRGGKDLNYKYYEAPNQRYGVKVIKEMSSTTQDAENEKFTGISTLKVRLSSQHYLNRHVYETYYLNEGKDFLPLKGWNVYDLLPFGMNLESSKEEIINNIILPDRNEDRTSYLEFCLNGGYYGKYVALYNGELLTDEDFLDVIKENTSVTIIRNYKNTGRDYLHIKTDFGDNNFVLLNESTGNYIDYFKNFVKYQYKFSVSYDSYVEYGASWTNRAYADFVDFETDWVNYHVDKWNTSYYSNDPLLDNGIYSDNTYEEESDINNNGNTDDYVSKASGSTRITSVISTNQDLQVTVRSDLSNFDTGKVNTSVDSEYAYKLRARTGSNDITNLVIYDSLEKYAKDTNMEFFDPSRGYTRWYGEFLGVDTTNAESKGYTVKTYYSEKDEPGDLKTDNSWKVYTDSVDKTKVKSLAFEYLDSNGNPAVIPANSITYILIKMKSPSDEGIKTLAYNGCWTEWNAIDSITGEAADFITGINSNVVKVALPNSVEPTDIDLTIDKYWNDSNNKLNIRPNTTTIQVVPDGDLSKAIDVPLGSTNIDSNNSNHWYTTITVPKYDLDSNLIDYTLREDEIILEDGYKYTPLIDGNSITNTLTKEIELKKIWKDNTNSYLTRPNSVTYNVKQNGNNYKEVTFTGTYNINQWTKTITVPVYDSSNREYNYSIEEININNYSSSCEDFVCTNTLTGKDNINVNKEWIDNNNIYDTRPNSITIHLLRNNDQYLDVILNQENNWNSDIEVDKYDSNGVKYNYTIAEDVIDEYGLVSYNQNSYKVTNTLKANTLLTITKQWVDDNNSNNTRPDELKITLLQNNNEYQELTLTGNSNTWTTTIEVPKYDNNQNKYKYSIREKTDNLNSDYSNITYSEEDLTVTNTLNRNMDLVIKKKWKDSDNKYFTRPENISINIYQDDELYKNVQLSGESNIWETVVRDVPVYSSNGKKYLYTIKEANTIEKYKNITYDQTNYVITNELTEIPTVTLYFTVVNGYIDPKTGEMKYDEFGLNEILKKYNVSPDDEYILNFEIENVDTHKIYDGKLSTKFVLEFKDIPYGKYKVKVGKDKLFEFVDMFSIEDVNGVSFKKLNNEMYISIEPTGDNIIYGAKIVNKINLPIENPKTGINIVITIVVLLALAIVSNRIVKKVLNKA